MVTCPPRLSFSDLLKNNHFRNGSNGEKLELYFKLKFVVRLIDPFLSIVVTIKSSWLKVKHSFPENEYVGRTKITLV
jgi:hypothetical protein